MYFQIHVNVYMTPLITFLLGCMVRYVISFVTAVEIIHNAEISNYVTCSFYRVQQLEQFKASYSQTILFNKNQQNRKCEGILRIYSLYVNNFYKLFLF